jgi:hypothetical protein
MTNPKADIYLPVTIRPHSLDVAHVVIFLPNTMMAGFEQKPIHVVFLVDNGALGQV